MVFAGDLEEESVDALCKRWATVSDRLGMSFSTDVPEGSASNGEQAVRVDGELVSHLGKGFPKGLWTFDKFTPGKGSGGIRWDHAKGAPERFAVADGGVSSKVSDDE